MTLGTRVKGAGALLLAGGLVLVALGRWTPANEEDGGIEVRPSARPARTKPCFRLVDFTANWQHKNIQARYVEWGPVGVTTTWWNVVAPFQQRGERVACGATVKIEVVFPDNVDPGAVECALTANHRVYEPLTDPENRHPRCVVEEVVP